MSSRLLPCFGGKHDGKLVEYDDSWGPYPRIQEPYRASMRESPRDIDFHVDMVLSTYVEVYHLESLHTPRFRYECLRHESLTLDDVVQRLFEKYVGRLPHGLRPYQRNGMLR